MRLEYFMPSALQQLASDAAIGCIDVHTGSNDETAMAPAQHCGCLVYQRFGCVWTFAGNFCA